MASSNRILIIGGGIGGLGLAQGLLKTNIPFRVFERESALNFRPQGYRVRIGPDGQEALQSLLAPALYARLVNSLPPNAPGFAPAAHLDALTGEAQAKPGSGPPPSGLPGAQNTEQLNADRGVLRQVLMQGLENHVEFGKDFKDYAITPRGVIARFSDGSEEEGALLVAADGIRSRIRKQFLPSFSLMDTETRIIYGKTSLTLDLENTLNASALNGLVLVKDASQEHALALLLETMRFKDNEYRKDAPEDYIYWALMARKERFLASTTEEEILKLSSDQAAELARTITATWDESFRPLFSAQSIAHTSILRVLSIKPEIAVWNSSPYVTLIGDAIHPMSPTAAAGATTALRDAAALVRCLSEHDINVEAAGEYEQQMRKYAGETVAKSGWGGKLLYGQWSFDDMEEVEED
ncbi:FAD/NAD(P)-binding domain-containing protein [Microthyrium microscopicum]|uniref:FAD/NAD(P)-binding domain-containing protein n=1 Tax=Microthyrium microscopicum TaxID=703497 RepID=A0A6A6UE52_9PEZI|nr:FAD/NAD(P)-binding domain-containing protein [Microthyrium microscopicum]